METYIALLRGINVSGHKIVKMDTLRKVLEELDFENIKSYIQSGNIIFDSSVRGTGVLENRITQKIEEYFGFLVPVMVVTPDALKTIVKKNPFPNLEDATQPYVAFLSEVPTAAAISVLQQIDFGGDMFTTIGKTIYLHYAGSVADTKLSNAAIERNLKIRATSRNWKTVLKLIELSDK